MRLMLHTLKKDIRRLWPAAAVTSLILAALSHEDRWRADLIPSPTEGWMNLLLSGAWACLAALAVFEEPLVGDRQFWTSRPYRWPALLAAKLAFAVLAIHLPSLLADVFVLSLRGFPPASHFSDLLSKQILFFGSTVLPAIAVAALVRNFTQFVIALFTIAAGIAVLSGGLTSFSDFSRQSNELRHTIVRSLLAGVAIAVVCIQYARRRAMAARVIGIAGALAAAAVSAYLPMRAEYAERGARPRETSRVVLRNARPDESLVRPPSWTRQHTVLLPIAIEPGPESARFHVRFIEIEIAAQDGTRIRSERPTPNRPFKKIDLVAHPYSLVPDVPPQWLVLSFSEAAWNRLKSGRARVGGSVGLEFYHPGETTILPAHGSVNAPGVGRCTAMTVDDRFSEGWLLKVLCESPRVLPATSINLRHEPSGRVWRNGLLWATTHSPGPNRTWLSPLHRAQAFFRVTNSAATEPGAQWLVPGSYVSSAHVEITPEIVTRYALARFDFTEVTLSSWLARREGRPRQ